MNVEWPKNQVYFLYMLNGPAVLKFNGNIVRKLIIFDTTLRPPGGSIIDFSALLNKAVLLPHKFP